MKITITSLRTGIVSMVVLLVFLGGGNTSYQQTCVGPAFAPDQRLEEMLHCVLLY
jgi:hypothetical protein